MSQKRIQVIGNHLAYKSDLPIYPLESSKKVLEDNDVVIVGYSRTPIGSFNGSLSSLSAVSLGATSIKKSVSMSGLQLKDVDGVYMGNVLQANEGQAPARQAALEAGLSNTTPSTTINKVCASGMKAIMLGAQDIICGTHDIVVSGGMESMSNVPYYLPKARNGLRMGDGEVVDGLMKDGLKDAYAHHAMGVIAESTAKEYNISRKEQDDYATTSYQRAIEAWNKNIFQNEIAPVEVNVRGQKKIIDKDEEHTKDYLTNNSKVKVESLPTMKGVFGGAQTVTAGNASSISDGASALVLTSLKNSKDKKIKPLFRILSWADAATTPDHFTIAPSLAIPLACARAGVRIDEIDYFEINEAFSVVAEANCKILKLQKDKVNIYGGGVSLGHPLGSSGSRIVVTLCTVLTQKNARLGCAAICNGGGGASAIIIERL